MAENEPVPIEADAPEPTREQRIAACEAELADTLERHRCFLIPHVTREAVGPTSAKWQTTVQFRVQAPE